MLAREKTNRLGRSLDDACRVVVLKQIGPLKVVFCVRPSNVGSSRESRPLPAGGWRVTGRVLAVFRNPEADLALATMLILTPKANY
jgi:hypothetical protein